MKYAEYLLTSLNFVCTDILTCGLTSVGTCLHIIRNFTVDLLFASYNGCCV